MPGHTKPGVLGVVAAIVFLLAGSLAGCATTSGTYIVSATDASGQPVGKNLQLMAEGSRVYNARNGFCIAHPKSIVIIRDAKTGQELKGESPYQCP